MSSTASKNANAMLFGAVIGLAAGMLFAPKSGRENRERLAQEYGKTKEQLQKGSQDILEKAKTTAGKMKKKTDETADDLQNRMDSDNNYPPAA